MMYTLTDIRFFYARIYIISTEINVNKVHHLIQIKVNIDWNFV